jgi:xanthine dehydrogenase large subunit
MNRQSETFLDQQIAAREASAAGIPAPHESAHLHVAGEATYTDDIPELAGTVYAALGLSTKAHARLTAMDLGWRGTRSAPARAGTG